MVAKKRDKASTGINWVGNLISACKGKEGKKRKIQDKIENTNIIYLYRNGKAGIGRRAPIFYVAKIY